MCKEQICKKFQHLTSRWLREQFRNIFLATGGEGPFDTEGFAALIRDTIQAYKDFVQYSNQIGYEKIVATEFMDEFRCLLTEIYNYYHYGESTEDKSADRIITASRAVTKLLFSYYPGDEPAVLRGHIEDFDMPLRSDIDIESLRERVFSYDTSTGDLSEMIEFAKLVTYTYSYEEPDDLPF